MERERKRTGWSTFSLVFRSKRRERRWLDRRSVALDDESDFESKEERKAKKSGIFGEERGFVVRNSKEMEYRLSALLEGHTDDVRSLTASSSTLYSTSRDSTIRSWAPLPAAVPTAQETTGVRSGSSQRWREVAKLEPENAGFINASHAFSVISPPPDSAPATKYLATGGQSSLVQIWSIPLESSDSPAFTLIGHQANVCAIHSTPTTSSGKGKKLVTGSWDGTARIWDSEKEFECAAVLEGHKGAVWDVLFVKQSTTEGDSVLTGLSRPSLFPRNRN